MLHSFGGVGVGDGNEPFAGLVYVKGLLYGTTAFGGAYGSQGYGTGFSISTGGTEKLLYSFHDGSDGAGTSAGLIDVSGILYGIAGGGLYDFGTVFSITTTGTVKVLYSFHDGSDGGTPVSGLVYAKGLLYGTTSLGGHSNFCGTVYSVSMTGTEMVLHNFGHKSDGCYSRAGLLYVNGTLYGTTKSGGRYHRRIGGDGTVFALTP